MGGEVAGPPVGGAAAAAGGAAAPPRARPARAAWGEGARKKKGGVGGEGERGSARSRGRCVRLSQRRARLPAGPGVGQGGWGRARCSLWAGHPHCAVPQRGACGAARPPPNNDKKTHRGAVGGGRRGGRVGFHCFGGGAALSGLGRGGLRKGGKGCEGALCGCVQGVACVRLGAGARRNGFSGRGVSGERGGAARSLAALADLLRPFKKTTLRPLPRNTHHAPLPRSHSDPPRRRPGRAPGWRPSVPRAAGGGAGRGPPGPPCPRACARCR
jgi:hypothetical protein